MRWFFQASVSDCSNPRLYRLLLFICPIPYCYSNSHHIHQTGSSSHLGVPGLRPRISVFHTRLFAHLGVSRLRPSITNTHPVFHLPSGSGNTAFPPPYQYSSSFYLPVSLPWYPEVVLRIVTCLEFASWTGFDRKVSYLTYFYLTRFPTAKSEFQTRFETRSRYSQPPLKLQW